VSEQATEAEIKRPTRVSSRLRSAVSSLLHTVLRGQVGFTMGTNLLLMGTSLLSGSLAAHLLGPTGRGQLAAIQLWPLAIMTIGSGGIVEAASYFSGRFREQSGVFGITAIVMLAVMAVPLVLIGVVAMPHLLAAEPSRIVAESQVYMLIVPILFFVNTFPAVLRGRGDLRVWNVLRLTQPLGYVVILLAAAFVPVDHVTFVAFAMFGWIAAHVLLSLALLRWYLPGPHRFEGEQVGPMLRYGARSISATTPSWLNGRMDQLVMGAFLSPHLLGLYAVAVSWSLAVTPVSNAFGQVILPRLAGAHGSEDAAERLCATSRIASGINVLMGLGVPADQPAGRVHRVWRVICAGHSSHHGAGGGRGLSWDEPVSRGSGAGPGPAWVGYRGRALWFRGDGCRARCTAPSIRHSRRCSDLVVLYHGANHAGGHFAPPPRAATQGPVAASSSRCALPAGPVPSGANRTGPWLESMGGQGVPGDSPCKPRRREQTG